MSIVYAILSVIPIAGFAIAGIGRVWHDVKPTGGGLHRA